MKKIVINVWYGGFGLSNEAEDLYAKKAGFELFRYVERNTENGRRFVKLNESDEVPSHILHRIEYTFKKDHGDSFSEFPDDDSYWYSRDDIERNDIHLIETIEELGTEKASAKHSKLKVVEIPDDVDYTIEEYEGFEHIAEVHRTWH